MAWDLPRALAARLHPGPAARRAARHWAGLCGRLSAAVRGRSRWPARWLDLLLNHEFRDARLILEQDGEVRYWVVSAGWQRRAVRGAAGALAVALVTLSVTLVYGLWVSLAKQRLERSHQNIYRALLEVYDGANADAGAMSEDDMLAIADGIRRRDMEIRRFVDRSVTSFSTENAQLGEALRASGLTERAIRVIQMNTPIGGTAEPVEVDRKFARVQALTQAIADNRSLRETLEALPDHLPVDTPEVSSGFGLRNNPFSGRPQFHSGVDLLPAADLLVHPAKNGTVVLASYGQELGNVVVVRHGGGIETLYGHMASLAVRAGDEVTERSVLGVVGNTGTATTGRHLHFEVTVGGYPVDPLKVIETAKNVRKIESQQ